MKKGLLLIAFVCLTASVAFSQGISIGLRGGLTLTSGNTTLPQTGTSPEIKNEGDGMGTGFLFGATARVKLGGIFLQGELNYGQFLLKQKADFNTDVSALLSQQLTQSLGFPVNLPASSITANTQFTTESTLSAINIPILIGKQFGPVRAYLGPSFLFVTQANQKRRGATSFGGTTLDLGVAQVPLPVTTTSQDADTDLLKEDAGIIEVKPLIIAVEAGVGVSLPMGLEADLRYSVPAITGVYKNSDVKGFLGILSLSVGYRLVKLGL